MTDKSEGPFSKWLFLGSVGLSLVLATFIGLYIGIYLDGVFSTKPWLTVVFLILGIIAGFRNIFILIKKYGL